MNPNMKIFHMLFPGGLDRALTLSYDDGVVQDRRLSELCRSRGVKCTFNLNSGTLGRVETATAPGREPLDISCVTPDELQTVSEKVHKLNSKKLEQLKLDAETAFSKDFALKEKFNQMIEMQPKKKGFLGLFRK